MPHSDDIQYALENTTVLRRAPGVLLEGTSIGLTFCILAEDPDLIDVTHVIEGTLNVTLDNRKMLTETQVRAVLENFDNEAAKDYFQNLPEIATLKQRFVLTKTATRHTRLHTPIGDVKDNALGVPSTHIILETPLTGWEVSLLGQAAQSLILRLKDTR